MLLSICFLFASAILSGCWVATSAPRSTLPYKTIKTLDRLIGESSKYIVREMGLPDQKITDGNREYLMYHKTSSGGNFLFVGWMPVPLGGAGLGRMIHCVRFELDSSNYAKEYQVKSRIAEKSVSKLEIHKQCRAAYWYRYSKEMDAKVRLSPDFSEFKLGRRINELLKNAASPLDAGTGGELLRLYDDLKDFAPEIAHKSLCKSADHGYEEARYRLGEIFEDNNNYVQGYIWYSLSGRYSDIKDLEAYSNRHLTKDQYQQAKKAIREWRPGQCESELNLVEKIL